MAIKAEYAAEIKKLAIVMQALKKAEYAVEDAAGDPDKSHDAREMAATKFAAYIKALEETASKIHNNGITGERFDSAMKTIKKEAKQKAEHQKS